MFRWYTGIVDCVGEFRLLERGVIVLVCQGVGLDSVDKIEEVALYSLKVLEHCLESRHALVARNDFLTIRGAIDNDGNFGNALDHARKSCIEAAAAHHQLAREVEVFLAGALDAASLETSVAHSHFETR